MNFSNKVIIAMLHMKSDSKMNAIERMKHEAAIYKENNVDAVLVENYFGDAEDCEEGLAWLQENIPDICRGVNILGDFQKSFELADKYGAQFIQIDSVCGHLSPKGDDKFADELLKQRNKYPFIEILGGVRFKYQPVSSGRSLEEDLTLGKKRCSAVVTTGEGTGIMTPVSKLCEFHELLGDFPLIVGAGVTTDTVVENLLYTDGAIVGSYFKENHHDVGDVCEKYVKEFMNQVYLMRSKQGN